MTKSMGCPYYTALEVTENGIYSNQCDIWSWTSFYMNRPGRTHWFEQNF